MVLEVTPRRRKGARLGAAEARLEEKVGAICEPVGVVAAIMRNCPSSMIGCKLAPALAGAVAPARSDEQIR
jgi:acyl-CoA reductase-like NAD-dependent aldehyde dehydrogenase